MMAMLNKINDLHFRYQIQHQSEIRPRKLLLELVQYVTSFPRDLLCYHALRCPH